MSISRFNHFLRRDKRLNGDWHRGQFWDSTPDQRNNTTIVEYQDRWTKTPSRMPIRLDNGSNQR